MVKSIANHDLPAPPTGKYPAKDHVRRVAKHIAENGGPNTGIIYVEGQMTKMVEDDDQATHFRQRRHFYYVTGCDLPDCYFAYDIEADESTLWIPPVDPDMVMWAGMPLLPDAAREQYNIDHVLTTDDLKSGKSLASMLKNKSTTVFTILDRADLDILHSDEIAKLKPDIDTERLRPAIEANRMVKDDYEIAMIRHANIVSSYAHQQVLKSVHAASNERELNAVFVMHCHANGCREQAYGCICAAGPNASSLHYLHNDQAFSDKQNLLLDAGCEYNTYCSDITRTFPLNPSGKFTPESKAIYNLVLAMQSHCMAQIRANVRWEDVHLLAHRVAAQGLRDLGILNSEQTVDEIMETKVTTRFFPHGLGHFIGMDTHDVGGNADPDDPDEIYKYLRIRGRLPANSVVTNEPGIYFRPFPLKQELADGKWDGVVDQLVLARYWAVGGIRIEDDVWVKEDGCENLTTVVSALEDVEAAVLEGRSGGEE
ncbi:hypothetical protein MBLNU230_g5579t1 [Neophaeotheca triangularis]